MQSTMAYLYRSFGSRVTIVLVVYQCCACPALSTVNCAIYFPHRRPGDDRETGWYSAGDGAHNIRVGTVRVPPSCPGGQCAIAPFPRRNRRSDRGGAPPRRPGVRGPQAKWHFASALFAHQTAVRCAFAVRLSCRRRYK